MKRLSMLVFVVLLVACQPDTTGTERNASLVDGMQNATDGFLSLQEREVRTRNGQSFIVDPEKLRDGGPPKDGIPSIDDPQFSTVAEADEWIADNEQVLAVERNGATKAYPLQILVWHEIVNDKIGGEPVAVTYCPLCGSGIAYKRVLENQTVEFGVSGKLYNSNLVMYDRLTETYWSQIDGVGIVGKHAGVTLDPVPIDTVTWGGWKEGNPDAKVLNRNTGYMRDYGEDPYGSYYNDSNLFFPVENEDNSIHPKTVVHGVGLNGAFKAYPEDRINGSFTDTVGNVTLRIEKEDGVTITRTDTGERVAAERSFWFAWYAFHPDTELYR